MRIISIAVSWLIASGFAGIASAQSFQLLQAPLGISGIPVTINGNGIGCCTADFDGDGDVSLIELETNGLELKKDLSGKLYADDQPLYMSGATQLTETYFAAYTPVAVEDFRSEDRRVGLECRSR